MRRSAKISPGSGSIPMPHYEMQTAELNGLQVGWANDMNGSRPIVVPESISKNPFAKTPVDQLPRLNAARIPLNKKFTTVTLPSQISPSISEAERTSTGSDRDPADMYKETFSMAELKTLVLGAPSEQSSHLTSREATDAFTEGLSRVAQAIIVPAVAFPRFKTLPQEVKILVWNNALPKFVEIIVNENRDHFSAPGPRDAILGLCRDHVAMFHMKPLHFPSMSTDQTVPDVIYLRPEIDTVYIGSAALLDLDIEAFCANPANQAIENLALSAVGARDLRWCGENMGKVIGTRNWRGDLVRGLTNLKKLYIVEGERFHAESEVELWSSRNHRSRRFEFTLRDVPTKTKLPKYDHRGRNHFWPPAKPWLSTMADQIVKKIKDEVEREKSKAFGMHWTGEWSQPEIICKLVTRNEIRWAPFKKPATKLRLPPAPLPAPWPMVRPKWVDPYEARIAQPGDDDYEDFMDDEAKWMEEIYHELRAEETARAYPLLEHGERLKIS
ncbi:hypothetical protein BJ878DRAFT_541484 [Calycina marina]|uniref:2EXR domain-containing protein n=1 Tax=Calycina marina TaxID=1763456 RepID=A0A9P7Z448_9HELO|nr:hypothetical protein BJ878DRAFT_541484 [Calycina marina]